MIISPENRAVFTEQLLRRRRRRGRTETVPTVLTSLRVPQPIFEAVRDTAHQRGVSVHATLRAAIECYVLDAGGVHE